MKHVALVCVATSVAFGGLACRSGGPRPQQISVERLSEQLKSDTPPKVFDANGESTRHEYGIIPGAVLLSSSRDYPLDLLPRDKSRSVVFYCASTWCGAAEMAAGRAMEAGYTAVSVLPDGIKGWVQAGLPVTPAPAD